MLARMWREKNLYLLLVKVQIGPASTEMSLEVS